MIPIALSRYFRVFKNDPVVTEVTDLHSPPTDPAAFTDYRLHSEGMEMAKLGAQQYINSLISKGAAGMANLLQYRSDHYEDLNVNLLYANIENVKRNEEGLPPINIPTDHLLWS